jgi:outer membrane lipoprotein-sorting protein
MTLLWAVLAAVVSAADTPAPTVDDLIARNVEARGGRDRLKAVEAIRMSGRMSPGPGTEAPIRLEIRRPDRIRIEITFQGVTAIQVFDGKSGWSIAPFRGKIEAVAMSAEDAAHASEQADLEGPLLDYKAKGHTVELVGPDKVDERDAWKLKLTLKNGTVRQVYLDAASFLEVKTESKRTIRGTEVVVEGRLGDYREVGGIRFPHSIENRASGMPQRQTVTVDKIELNPPLDEERFRMPAGTKPAPPR